MLRKSIKETIMERDKITSDHADSLINAAKDAFSDYLDEGDLGGADNICQEYFNLEPDYLDEFF